MCFQSAGKVTQKVVLPMHNTINTNIDFLIYIVVDFVWGECLSFGGHFIMLSNNAHQKQPPVGISELNKKHYISTESV